MLFLIFNVVVQYLTSRRNSCHFMSVSCFAHGHGSRKWYRKCSHIAVRNCRSGCRTREAHRAERGRWTIKTANVLDFVFASGSVLRWPEYLRVCCIRGPVESGLGSCIHGYPNRANLSSLPTFVVTKQDTTTSPTRFAHISPSSRHTILSSFTL